jgi:hypothetical protein
MEYRDLIIENLKKKYSNEIDIARTNIEIFLSSPQGVAEHIDYSETIEKELQKIAHASDMIESINYLLP